MRSEKLYFKNSEGEKLAARLDLPLDGKPKAYALFAHCFTCSKNLKAVSNINRALTREGIAVLRFDFTGLGESEGDFAETNFSSNVADLITAADFLKQQFAAPELLIGHSLGGAAVLQAAAKIKSCKAVATIGAPCDPVHVGHLLDSSREEIEAKGEAEIVLAGRKFTIKKQFLDDLEEKQMKSTIRNLKRALLILHSPIDNVVGIDNAAQIFQSALHPKSFVSLDKADHLLMAEDDSLYAGAVIAAWARKYIHLPLEEKKKVDLKDNRVIVETGSGYFTEIMANGHPLIADEPVQVGGTDRGASPYELLLAALGACTSITLRMYADRKQWPVEKIIVRLKHQKIHAQDCGECESGSDRIDRMEREIELLGPLEADQRQRLLEIADKCPVHRTLHSEVVVDTKLVADV
ncbi:MAG: alpha/beta fold hydrolase [Calditrichia bacterium]